MRIRNFSRVFLLGAGLILGADTLVARPKRTEDDGQKTSLNANGAKLRNQYADALKSLEAEIIKSVPTVDARKKAAHQQARAAVAKAELELAEAQKNLNAIGGGKALVDHAKNKWIGGAEKGIAAAEAALKKANSAAERSAAKADLAKWEANKEDGLKALKERQAAYDKAILDKPKLTKAKEAAQAGLTRAQAEEQEAVKSLNPDLESFLASDKMDVKLVRCMILAAATAEGLAQFAQQGSENEAMVRKLLSDAQLMKDMLVAGGAKFGKYGRAIEIYTAIQSNSSQAGSGHLQRLALATSLEHAVPIQQSNLPNDSSSPAHVDPLYRYLHYEKAFLAGELDPAFKNLTTWDYRHVVNCDAPDDVLTWGRQMLRNYRPDHIQNPNYGWRYVSSVKTEVPYGSQNVKNDLPTLHQYQNIIKNGGVCGRRAFFGRFILRCFGIPTWGVTQKAHAALSHWTPEGWVVNLGAGFEHSWWDKDEAPLSGSQFLLEAKARQHGDDYLKVLRAQWISRILGEEAYNERKNVEGGFWSNVARDQMTALASKVATLGPLGQELGEANEPDDKKQGESVEVTADQQRILDKDGTIIIPAVAYENQSGNGMAMQGIPSGMQLHCLGGFKADYQFNAPQAGKYNLTANVATVQDGQVFIISANNSKQPVETAVPYTIGMWQQTPPIQVTLERGKNTIHLELKQGSRGVTIKDFTLSAVK